ncbi:MAG: hypothetical protein JO129_00555 [Candidatus Dependentiae bacterium]|nr:hypothetical protein [Candidatus Dependentiae bacterium]
MSAKMFEKIVKAVVDVEKEIMLIDAPMHADQEYFLLEQGSSQENLWGINLVPSKFETENFVVFDSMINLRPGWGNFSRGVDDPAIQKAIKAIVNKFVRNV